MSQADLLLLAVLLIFALVSWLGAALGQRRERGRDGEAPARAPYDRMPRAPHEAIATGRPAPLSAARRAPAGAPSPTGVADARADARAGTRAGTRAPRRATLRSALRHRDSLRQAFVLSEILGRRRDLDP
ncbi:hypothetical protein [Sorangium sp. So ce341]|uniref:hypothetical protein n=1 Tax=Sorangium sp. So ce341 TaxID=3133302 RepID=UPI003F64492F